MTQGGISDPEQIRGFRYGIADFLIRLEDAKYAFEGNRHITWGSPDSFAARMALVTVDIEMSTSQKLVDELLVAVDGFTIAGSSGGKPPKVRRLVGWRGFTENMPGHHNWLIETDGQQQVLPLPSRSFLEQIRDQNRPPLPSL